MANPLSTHTSEVRPFTALSISDRRAVELRSEGKSYTQIMVAMKEDFGIEKSERTVREWFNPGGRLEQAYLDFSQELADASVKRAKQLAARLSERAIAALGTLMDTAPESSVRFQAAKTLASKYVPDRQVVLDGGKEERLPAAVLSAMEDDFDDDFPDDEPAETEAEPVDDGGKPEVSPDDAGESGAQSPEVG